MTGRMVPLAALLLLVGAEAQAQPASAAEIYSNVRLSRATGDLGGMELQLHRGPEGDDVEFVLCEGWCNHAVRVPVRIENGRFGFDYVESLTDENGRPLPPNVTRFEARLVRGAVILSAPRDQIAPTRLPPRSSRYGLDVATEMAGKAPR
jgi:hypothetical protein